MAKKNQWVIKYGDIWAVKGEGNTKVTKITKTQKEAIKNQKSELIIQNTEGKIRSKDSYGNDPYPPKDKEY